MTTQACMGGHCLKRDRCAHYHATDRTNPAERLCPPGQDGAGLSHLDDHSYPMADRACQPSAGPFTGMHTDAGPTGSNTGQAGGPLTNLPSRPSRAPKMPKAQRLDQIAALLTPQGTRFQRICEAQGLTYNRTSILLSALVKAGRAFMARANPDGVRVGFEHFYFPTQADRDRFAAAWAQTARERRVARERVVQGRIREAARIANAPAKAHAAAQRAQADLRRRMEREAKEAERHRLEALKETLKSALRVRTKKDGALTIMPQRAARPAPVKVPALRGPAHIPGELDLSRAKVTIHPTPPGRYAPDPGAPSTFGRIGTYLEPAASSAARALEAA